MSTLLRITTEPQRNCEQKLFTFERVGVSCTDKTHSILIWPICTDAQGILRTSSTVQQQGSHCKNICKASEEWPNNSLEVWLGL